MAFRGLRILKIIRNTTLKCNSLRASSSSVYTSDIEKVVINKPKEYKTESNLTFFEDPDNFGTLSRKIIHKDIPEDEDDIKEEKFIQNTPLPSQKLTIKQYADIIKQFIKHKRLKEAIDVLEVRMLTEDRVKPDNYIYNILIGACADVGYTKKAFKLFNDMKRRALKPTGDTYTCLFNACANSPWSVDGLKNAKHLRELMIEKGIEPNLTNYNVMIKAFGRCGDLKTAFMLVDEMASKKIKIRVHTLNNLLQACITDKNHGLRHALMVWRKLLMLREKPNIYSFNLILKCVKDCNLGSLEDIQELIGTIQETVLLQPQKGNKLLTSKPLELLPPENTTVSFQNTEKSLNDASAGISKQSNKILPSSEVNQENTNLTVPGTKEIYVEIKDFPNKLTTKLEERKVPNLLSKLPNMEEVLSLQEVTTVQEKFAIVGGQEDFLKEMETYSVKPDIKTFTQMLMVLEDTREAEAKLLEQMKAAGVIADIDFYNMLIKKRCFRCDYKGANVVTKLIEEEDEFRKKRYPLNKKRRLQLNVMSYGMLAMTCNTKEDAEVLLREMKEKQLKVNIAILGTLLRQATAHCQFGYVLHIMEVVQEENLKVNDVFIKHLEAFNDKCKDIVKEHSKNGQDIFVKAFRSYLRFYKKWLNEVNVTEALKPEHPWQQFRDSHPETLQRLNIVIKEPKKFYKRKRRFVAPYTVKI